MWRTQYKKTKNTQTLVNIDLKHAHKQSLNAKFFIFLSPLFGFVLDFTSDNF